MNRRNYELEILEIFKNLVNKYNYNYFSGQKTENIIPIKGLVNYQFGDFRVETKKYHLILELESGGGVTNLTKYWYFLKDRQIIKKGIINKKIILFHIYRQVSANDYLSHLLLWDFLWEKMESEIQTKMIAKRYTYKILDDLKPVIKDFEYYLNKF